MNIFPIIHLDNVYPSRLSFSYVKYDVLPAVFNMKHVKDTLIQKENEIKTLSSQNNCILYQNKMF